MKSGRDYATALFSLACEERAEEALMEILDQTDVRLREYPSLSEILFSPTLPATDREKLLQEVLPRKGQELLLPFFHFFCKSGSVSRFHECTEEYRRLLQRKNHVTVVTATFALPPTEAELSALQHTLKRIHGGEILLEHRVDPSILGGVILETEGKITDGSLRRRLHSVKEMIEQ